MSQPARTSAVRNEAQGRCMCGRVRFVARFSTRDPRWVTETHIALAAFEDPIDRAPTGHAFMEEHVPWTQIEGAPT